MEKEIIRARGGKKIKGKVAQEGQVKNKWGGEN